LSLAPAQLAPHLQAEALVQGRQRRVEQQDARLGDQRARQGDPLLLAARELRRHALRKLTVQLHLGEYLTSPRVTFRLSDATHLEVERDVVEDVQVGAEG